jgi:hypothetical protein
MADNPAGDDPDYGKDLSGLVPNVAVGAPWNGQPGPPSFNQDPPGQDPGSGDPPPPPPVSPLSVNLTSLRSAETSLISETTSLAADYENLRNKVMSSKDTVFGQSAIQTVITDPGQAAGGGGSGGQEHKGPSPIQGKAQEFAGHLNPAQERVLEQIANSLEIVGQFTAGLNRSGQSYGAADRKAQFPDPPPSPVT